MLEIVFKEQILLFQVSVIVIVYAVPVKVLMTF